MKHGNVLRRGLALVLSAAMAVSTAFASADKQLTNWDGETATIELSVEGGSRMDKAAVMFVLDKSTSNEVRGAAAEMLNEIASKTNTDIVYNVIIFSGTATTTDWQNIKNTDIASDFVNRETTSGTNMDAGIELAISEMNDLPSEYKDAPKFLITLSDGITYVWTGNDGEVKCVPVQGLGTSENVETEAQNGADTWAMFYEYGSGYADIYAGGFDEFMQVIPSKMNQTTKDDHVQNYYGERSLANPINTWIYDDEKNKTEATDKYACGTDFAVYESAKGYEQLVDMFDYSYAYAVPETDSASDWDDYPWGQELMEYLQSLSTNASDETIMYNSDAEKIFAPIKDQLLFDIQSGELTDVIGDDFDLVYDSFNLTVDGQPVEKDIKDQNNNIVYFGNEVSGEYEYKVTYTPGEPGDEKFVWEINTPVTSKVVLEYQVKLVNRETAEGTYTVPTNESAILDYESSEGRETPIELESPEVTYTVGNGGNPGGGDDNDKPSGGGDNDRYEGPDLTVVKVDEDGETIESNARFRIYKEQGSKTMWYKGNQSWSEDEEDAWIFNTSVGDGSFTAYDLKPGTYYIVEISAPEGYDLAEEPLEVEVESRDVTVEFVNSGDGVVTTPTKPVPDTGR